MWFEVNEVTYIQGFGGVKYVVSKRYDLVVDFFIYLEPDQCKDLSIWVMCSVFQFQLWHEQESFPVAGDEKSAFR